MAELTLTPQMDHRAIYFMHWSGVYDQLNDSSYSGNELFYSGNE